MRTQSLIFCTLLTLGSLAACETRHPTEVTTAVPPPLTQRPPVTSQHSAPLPTTTPAASADTASRLSQALGPKLEGYQLESFTTGDINEDHRPDFIAIFQEAEARDTTAYEPRGFRSRRVALILNQGWPRLKLAATNDNVIDCIGCAHMAIFDAYQGTTIKGPYFSFESTDGGCDRTMDVLTFRYSKAEKNWFLHKAGRDSRNCSSYEDWSHEEKTRRDFGKIAFEKFEFSPL
ncbi:MAG: hypothetical protein ACRYF0_07755 [Janthinobacterium lividum]